MYGRFRDHLAEELAAIEAAGLAKRPGRVPAQ